uniref:Uncharacterized protein n=1 Tax=Anopheles minimus TaxID=112268 RepID=A0A182WNH2_9DIPT
MRKETAQLHLFAIDTNNSVRSCITKPAAGRKKFETARNRTD